MKTNNENSDYYRMRIGVRTLLWTTKELLINDEPLYLRGFGKHEDSIVSYHNVMNIKNKYLLISLEHRYKIYSEI